MSKNETKVPPLPKGAADESTEVGELTVGEMRLINQLRTGADQVVREIGNLEVRKSHLLAQLSQIEAQGQGVLAAAAKRLNIPEGETWHLSPDGKIRRGDVAPS